MKTGYRSASYECDLTMAEKVTDLRLRATQVSITETALGMLHSAPAWLFSRTAFRRRNPMIRKALLLLIPAALGLLIMSQWPDVRRYLKIRQLSQGHGHPRNVPAGGTRAYPQHPGAGEQDGTGDFDSASREARREYLSKIARRPEPVAAWQVRRLSGRTGTDQVRHGNQDPSDPASVETARALARLPAGHGGGARPRVATDLELPSNGWMPPGAHGHRSPARSACCIGMPGP
jgi:hypothetical protein